MAARSRLFRPLLYTTAAAAFGGGILYISYRPRHIPGSDPAVVPPPKYGEEGHLDPPRFPLVKTRGEQIADLKRGGGVQSALGKSKSFLGGFTGAGEGDKKQEKTTGDDAEIYDLLVIGGGATGSGIALDAATRGLRVAMVERDDFASGTSSKSTKLVHGGVRYLEKAVWELDYNQYGHDRGTNTWATAENTQVQAGEGGVARAKVLSRYRTTSIKLAANHDTHPEMVASPLFLGWHKVLRLPGWV